MLQFLSRIPFFAKRRFAHLGGSSHYWERRYRNGGNSGDGSYGSLAQFKAKVLNDFVEENRIASVIEFGSGDGNQISIARYPRYLGLDVSPTAVRMCATRFREDTSKSFMLYDPRSWHDGSHWIHADLVLSLDVLYHLVEDEIFELHLRHVFSASDRFVIVYSSDKFEPSPVPHVRARKFTVDVQRICPEFQLQEVVHPPRKSSLAKAGPDSTAASFYIFAKLDHAGM